MNSFSIEANIVDIRNKKIFRGSVFINDNKIEKITEEGPEDKSLKYLMPGFVDSHVHIESSMLVPSEFARLAVVHGTVATISDPHEIANVCGMEGVQYMINNGKTVPFKFHFGAPSCVPATIFETAGASINADDVSRLLENDDIFYLSEMMNFPGVLFKDEQVMKKLEAAKRIGKPIDGHAPGLRGKQAEQYINEGISTDHECFTKEEAAEKLLYGMKILIREGSAAKNFEALIDLLPHNADRIMFCSDDKHPDSLLEGHINQLCARAIKKGIAVFDVLRAACLNPVEHYKMKVGTLQPGDYADFILVEDLNEFKVNATYINGQLVAENGNSLIEAATAGIINQFNCETTTLEMLAVPFTGQHTLDVIEALDGQLITNRIQMPPLVSNNLIESDITNDVLKMVVVNRYHNAPVAKSFVKNFGLKTGAIASTVAHDSHNIIAVGTDDKSLSAAINKVIDMKGGISAICNDEVMSIALPVAGLMSVENGYTIANDYTAIDRMVKTKMGSTLTSPFMTLSFMALLVIPHLKLSDKGLFNGDTFEFVS